jgi:hypothetical protein
VRRGELFDSVQVLKLLLLLEVLLLLLCVTMVPVSVCVVHRLVGGERICCVRIEL